MILFIYHFWFHNKKKKFTNLILTTNPLWILSGCVSHEFWDTISGYVIQELFLFHNFSIKKPFFQQFRSQNNILVEVVLYMYIYMNLLEFMRVYNTKVDNSL